MSSGWFDCIEPSLTTSLEGKQFVQFQGEAEKKDLIEELTQFCPTKRFGTVEPPRTHVKELYTPCTHCNDVVQEGSRRFDALEPVHKHPEHLASPLKM